MYESYRAGINLFAWNGLPAQNWSASPQANKTLFEGGDTDGLPQDGKGADDD